MNNLLTEYMIESDKFKLVPDRWSPTGWKYLKEEQICESKFFTNPNRTNSHGLSPDSKFAKH